jgi:hypothetical protein
VPEIGGLPQPQARAITEELARARAPIPASSAPSRPTRGAGAGG